MLYLRAASKLRTLHTTLGVARRAKDITPPDPIAYARRYSEVEEAEVV